MENKFENYGVRCDSGLSRKSRNTMTNSVTYGTEFGCVCASVDVKPRSRTALIAARKTREKNKHSRNSEIDCTAFFFSRTEFTSFVFVESVVSRLDRPKLVSGRLFCFFLRFLSLRSFIFHMVSPWWIKFREYNFQHITEKRINVKKENVHLTNTKHP